MLVVSGYKLITDRLQATPAKAAFSHMAIGTGTGQTPASTTLAAEVARVALDAGYPKIEVVDPPDENLLTFKATFPAGTGTGVITEAAVFNDVAAGDMLNYWVFPTPRVKLATDPLVVTLRIRFGSVAG